MYQINTQLVQIMRYFVILSFQLNACHTDNTKDAEKKTVYMFCEAPQYQLTSL